MSLHFKYEASRAFAEQIGLTWLDGAEDLLKAADADAHALGMTQEQVDVVMRHHLRQVKWLFTPSNYSDDDQTKIAAMFIQGS